MVRVIAGFVLAPMVFALGTGSLALLVLPIMYFFMLLVAVPLFLLFRRLGWLGWWHATLAGFATASAFVGFYWRSANPYHVDLYGPVNSIDILAIGTTTGLIFWAIAIFRNPAIPQREVEWRVFVLVMATLALGSHFYREHVKPREVYGVVLTLPTEQAYITDLSVRLDSGNVVTARAIDVKNLMPGRAVFLETRHSMISPRSFYWIIGCRDHALC